MSTIESLLASLDLSNYVSAFKKEEIDLEAAKQLSEDNLKELGLTMGARKKLYSALHSVEANSATQTKPNLSQTYPPANPEEGAKDSRIDLDGKKSIRSNASALGDFSQRLKKLFGPEYYFSFDYGLIVESLNKAIQDLKNDSWSLSNTADDYPKRVGELLHNDKQSYLASIIRNLEEFATDSMNVEAFKAKCSKHVIVIQPGIVTSSDDPYEANKWSFVDGAFVVVFNPKRIGVNTDSIAYKRELSNML